MTVTVKCSKLTSLLLAIAAIAAPLSAAHSETTLRVVMHSDLKILDPIWTTARIVTDHGYMIYDTLFGADEKFEIRPQMLDRWSVSEDKKTWTFTLRDGLEFHDGQPVTSEDCIASLKRWAQRDVMGQKLLEFVDSWNAVDAKAFTLKLKEPYGLVLDTLGKPSSAVPFIMPKRVAETDPAKQISDTTGSGPFIFNKDLWKPGDKTVYMKNPKYKPRAEPPSGLAGGKVAKVDRIEWIWIADPLTQVNAILAGEIDYIQTVGWDLVPLVAKEPSIISKVYIPEGRQFTFRFNTLHKPFDNPKIREAVAYGFSQRAFLEASIGNPDWFKECKSVFPCGTPYESAEGWGDKLGNLDKAKAALKDAGYDGTTVVLLQSTDNKALVNLAPVAKVQLEKIGFKVDLQSMDWQSVVARRTKKDAPDKGGWSAFLTSWGAVDILNPVSHAYVNAACEKSTFGWPCDAEMEKLRDQFARETDPAKQKALAAAVTARNAVSPNYIHLGQYVEITSHRKAVTGILQGATTVLWNIEKK